MSSGHRKLEELQNEFNAVPLFDESLSEELAVLEQRRFSSPARIFKPLGRQLDDSPVSVGFSRGTTPREPPLRTPWTTNIEYPPLEEPPLTAQPAFFGAGRQGPTFQLPPKIERPWSVERLLKRSGDVAEGTKVSAFRAIATNANTMQSSPTVLADSERQGESHARHEKRKGIRRVANRADDRSAREPMSTSDRTAMREAVGTTDEKTTTDDEFLQGPKKKFLEELYGSSEMTVAADNLFKQKNGLFSVGVDLDVDEKTIEAQLDMAAARARIVQQRRGDTRQSASIALQTDSIVTHHTPDLSGESPSASGSTKSARVARSHAPQSASGGAPPVPKGYVLLPSVPFNSIAQAEESHETVWKKMAHEQSQPDSRQRGQPSAFTLARQSSASGLVETPKGRRSSINADQLLQARNTLLTQLDQVQLSSEEVLLRNRLLNVTGNTARTVPVGDDQLAGLRSSKLAEEAIVHVAAANMPSTPQVAPIGGYGSVMDPPSSVEQDTKRWRAAKRINEESHPAMVKPIRNWAADLPAPPIFDRTAHLRPPVKSSATSLEADYDARKKWGPVSFVLDDGL